MRIVENGGGVYAVLMDSRDGKKRQWGVVVVVKTGVKKEGRTEKKKIKKCAREKKIIKRVVQ